MVKFSRSVKAGSDFFSKTFKSWPGLLTSFYLSLIILLLSFRWDEFVKLPLNELGDFTAGIFGPVAFLWLILGYKQQGEELKISSEALKSQVVELNNSFQLQREVAEKQDMALDPVLHISYAGSAQEGEALCDVLNLQNLGATCRSVTIDIKHMRSDIRKNGFMIPAIAEGGDISLKWDGVIIDGAEWDLTVTYTRINGSKGVQKFLVAKIFGTLQPIVVANTDTY